MPMESLARELGKFQLVHDVISFQEDFTTARQCCIHTVTVLFPNPVCKYSHYLRSEGSCPFQCITTPPKDISDTAICYKTSIRHGHKYKYCMLCVCIALGHKSLKNHIITPGMVQLTSLKFVMEWQRIR